MDTKLCRICGKLSENYVHIFKIEGLKNKIETCLPIIVSPHCLLPDTICSECLDNVDNFYSFIKNCLQNIIVLESQYDIMESCLKTKRKHEKGCYVDFGVSRFDKNIQTEEEAFYLNANSPLCAEFDKLTVALTNASNILNSVSSSTSFNLVSYDESDNEDCDETKRRKDNDFVEEIAHKKSLKRCSDTILSNRTKIFKMDNFNKRKNRRPKKVQPNFNFNNVEEAYSSNIDKSTFSNYFKENMSDVNEHILLPQICLICEAQLSGPATLAAHVYEVHGIDMAQIASSEPVLERKKKIPNLLKIADLKTKECTKDTCEEPPILQPTFVCPICPAVLTNRVDLFAHLKSTHPEQASLMCGLCLFVCDSYSNLSNHLTTCKQRHNIVSQNVCKICSYNDDNSRIVENHVAIHDFILDFCKKQLRMFDPSDYIEVNPHCEIKMLNCNDCGDASFSTFKDFSTHRRSKHQKFHCDLCNKFYGRNSHLWKHVNRLHKGHPSITCLLCHKTSASKYHLSQHFNKIHCAKPSKPKQNENSATNFMKQKFCAFDFQSVRQTFLRQEMLQREECKMSTGSDDCNSDIDESGNGDEMYFSESNTNDMEESERPAPPKEIDSSSNLYTNIITNYTPPQNEGTFKCPTCFKSFHKKLLLKKHKKNCRPRLQKDLLTRCKTCSRIFKDRQSLTKHLINYHSEYTCEICGQKVQSKCEIVSHIRFLHPSCHLFCHCGNILRSTVDLFEHSRDHRNSFVCQFCGDMLSTKIKLKMHILSLHRKILSLSCGICLKLFETQHILRDHVRLVHKDELSPTTSCIVCGKNYGSKWKTYDHINKSHGRIFKACKICLEIFDTEEQLKVHFENTHIGSSQIKVPVQIKKDVAESEGELNEKGSSSELSNDNYGLDTSLGQLEKLFEETENPKSQDLARETKISLLEKRLLGLKRPSQEQGDSFIQQEKLKKEQLSIPKIKSEFQEPSTSKPKKSSKTPDVDLDLEQSYNPNPLHNSSKRTVYVNSNDPSLCEICLKTWPAKKHLWQHYIRCHKTVAATVCGICLKTNNSYEALQIHLLENHPNLLYGQGFGSNFICRICGRYHNASSKLKLHMAIHEKFDWSILDTYSSDKTKQETSNGYLNIKNEKHQSINYESLIEQVECSSNSEDSEGEPKDDAGNSSSDDESNNESNSENSLEEPSLENYNRAETFQNEPEIKKDIKIEYSSFESEASSDSNQSVSDVDPEGKSGIYEFSVQIKSSSDDDSNRSSENIEKCLTQNGIENVNMFIRKPEELDFAIRSISYEQVVNVREQIRDDICEIQSHSLNPHELQSAVDSIL